MVTPDITPSKLLEHKDYSHKDIETVPDARSILKLLDRGKECENEVELQLLKVCVANVLNDRTQTQQRYGDTWPVFEKVDALGVARRIFQNRQRRVRVEEMDRVWKQEKKLYVKLHVASPDFNGKEAHVIAINATHAMVITSPNNGKSILVKKDKCEIIEYKDFIFDATDEYQAFPKGAAAPPGFSYDMSLSDRPYNLYKKL